MAKIAPEIFLAGIKLEKLDTVSLHIQLYEHIRQAILTRRLRSGQKLPATRTFATELAVSRNTVSLAFEQLIIEGYLRGKTGSGTYVADHIPDKLLQIKKTGSQPEQKKPLLQKPVHTDFGLSEELMKRNKIREKIIPFQTAIPAFDAFPYQAWAKIANVVYRNFSSLPLGYNNAAGYRPLREAIAGYLRTARAVKCEAENILIVSGSQQGLNLTAQVLLRPGDEAWIEDPGYHGARATLLNAGAKLCPVPVNEEGLDIAFAVKHFSKAKMAYLTPSHQYPLGGTMPLTNRLKLLEWAQKNDMWLLEDDYDSELRYLGRPLASLQGLDKGDKVIYLGTFSKVLFPALRLGYLVLPSIELMEAFTSAKAMADRQNAVTEQAILATFIQEGHFARHLRKMRVLYQQRQEILLQVAKIKLSGLLDIVPADAGMHVVGWLPDYIPEKEASQRAAQYGVIAHPISEYTIQHHARPGLLLGYTSFDETSIHKGIDLLAQALKSFGK